MALHFKKSFPVNIFCGWKCWFHSSRRR